MASRAERSQPGWLGITALVGAILATRVLGLMIVLPGFVAYYATGLGWSPAVVGVAFGAYAASMALLQIPFGLLSDRWGRKNAILVGLVVSIVGSFLAAAATTPPLLILARLVQGAGAVNGVALALLGERVPDAKRTTAMGLAGAAIGVGVVGGLVGGAVLGAYFAVPALFVLNGALVIVTFVLALALLPREKVAARSAGFAEVARAATTPALLRLNGGQFATNFSLNAILFLFTPDAEALVGHRNAELALALVAFAGGVVMLVASRAADRGGFAFVARLATILLGVGAIAVAVRPDLATLLFAGAVFFSGQSVLAALLPSAASRVASAEARASAQSGLQVSGYVGAFLGALAAGALVASRVALAGILALVSALAFFALSRLEIAPR